MGSKLSLADVTLYALYTEFFDDKSAVENALQGADNIKSCVASVANNQNVQAYLATRKPTAFWTNSYQI